MEDLRRPAWSSVSGWNFGRTVPWWRPGD